MTSFACFIVYQLEGLQVPSLSGIEELSPFMRIVEITHGVVTTKELNGREHLVLSIHVDAETEQQAEELATQKATDAIMEVFFGASPVLVQCIIQTSEQIERAVRNLPFRESLETALSEVVTLREFTTEFRPQDN